MTYEFQNLAQILEFLKEVGSQHFTVKWILLTHDGKWIIGIE